MIKSDNLEYVLNRIWNGLELIYTVLFIIFIWFHT